MANTFVHEIYHGFYKAIGLAGIESLYESPEEITKKTFSQFKEEYSFDNLLRMIKHSQMIERMVEDESNKFFDNNRDFCINLLDSLLPRDKRQLVFSF